MTGENIIEEAKNYLGSVYVPGGDNPNGFDSLGFIKYIFKKVAGKNLSQNYNELINVGKKVGKKELKKGDIIFSHKQAGIYIGDGQIITVDKKKGVKIATIVDFNTARRVL